MKAAQITGYGDPSVVHITEADKPVANNGQVVVEVHASSLNPFDTTVRAGLVQQMMPLHFPATLGADIAGIVTEVGNGVTNVAVGDKVYGQANAVFGDSGALAEYAATAADHVAKAPENLEFTEIASLPLIGVSAIQGLTQHINLVAGQKILITGGAGGIGSIAIQIAKNIGAYVAATATGNELELVKQLGADEVIDYKNEDFFTVLTDYDAVFDTVGATMLDKTLHILKKGGIAVTMAAQPNESLAKELGVTVMNQMTQVTTKALDTLRNLVEQKVVTPRIGATFPLDQIAEAFRTREGSHSAGKVIITVK
jgi:NADPH:quinone reductase-like Zn-dependent oxidoreductase